MSTANCESPTKKSCGPCNSGKATDPSISWNSQLRVVVHLPSRGGHRVRIHSAIAALPVLNDRPIVGLERFREHMFSGPKRLGHEKQVAALGRLDRGFE